MIENMPEMVIQVLLGFAIYKIVIFLGTSAGIYGTIRLGINKWHDYKTQKMTLPKTVEYKIGDKCLTSSALSELERLLDEMKEERSGMIGGQVYKMAYVTDTEIILTRKLLKEHRQRVSNG